MALVIIDTERKTDKNLSVRKIKQALEGTGLQVEWIKIAK